MNISSEPSKSSRFWRAGGTLLAIGLLIYLLSQQGWDEIGTAIRKLTWGRVLLAFGVTVLSRFAVGGRWHVILRAAGLNITATQSIRITYAGLFASNFLLTTIGGDAVRLGATMRLGYDRAICLASLVMDRLVGMAGMGMAALTVFFTLPGILSQWLQNPEKMVVIETGRPWMILSASLSVRETLTKWCQRGRHIIKRLLEIMSVWLRKPRSLLIALGFTWIHMLCVFSSIALLLPALDERMPFWVIAGLWSLTYFITLLPISVNGLGVQELSMTFLFTTFGGISATSGFTLALAMRLLPMFASLPGAIFLPEMMAGRKKEMDDTLPQGNGK